jgi:hypothetical protein
MILLCLVAQGVRTSTAWAAVNGLFVLFSGTTTFNIAALISALWYSILRKYAECGGALKIFKVNTALK